MNEKSPLTQRDEEWGLIKRNYDILPESVQQYFVQNGEGLSQRKNFGISMAQGGRPETSWEIHDLSWVPFVDSADLKDYLKYL